MEQAVCKNKDSRGDWALLGRDWALLKKHRLTPSALLVFSSQRVASLEKVDSSLNAQNLHKQADSTFLSSRNFRKEVVAIHKFAKADSSNDYSANAEFVDCHADFQSARNDSKNAKNVKTSQKVDSSANALLLSLRENPQGFSWQSTKTKTQNLESTFLNNAEKSQSVAFLENKQRAVSLENKRSAVSLENQAKHTAQKKFKLRLKAEWEQQSAILLAFPHIRSDWASKIDQARQCFLHIIESIIAFERVLVCIDTHDTQGLAVLCQHFGTDIPPLTPYTTHALSATITLAFVPTNDTWARDFGVITCEVMDSKQNLLLDFHFNGWGLKYPSNFDNQITKSLHYLGALGSSPLESIPFILEGGSIDTDGLGTILTTTTCLLEPNRNPTYTKAEIESTLCHTLGATRVLWLENGFLQGDDTDSHIDMLARFIAPDTIAYISCDDESDPHYHALQAMEQEILAFRQADGSPYTLCRLPFVSAIYDESGERLPASYANFLFVNGALLVPLYNDPNDTQALQLLQAALPDRAVLGVNARTLIEWHGSLHCVSMQLY